VDLSGLLVNLAHILIFILISGLIGTIARGRWRSWAILIVSVLAIFWLQPASSIRHLDFWFPALSLALTIVSWVVTSAKSRGVAREDWITLLVIFLLLFILTLTRYTGEFRLTRTTPPGLESLPGFIFGVGTAFFLLSKLKIKGVGQISVSVFLLLGLFIILKTQPLGEMLSRGLRGLTGQSTEFASSLDLGWLGFSYIAFRLLHTLRETVLGKMPSVPLHDYVSYVLFFPALTAGPIDRIERFQKDIEQHEPLNANSSFEAGQRIVMGIFKKFVLADTFALFALNSMNALQVKSGFWLWMMLYAYALRLYLDFSGYTDIAIGMGQLVGVKLPENFNRPYLKSSITAFWNSWHITLAHWFRAYFFNPLTRALRRMKVQLPVAVIILITQVSTMALIGLWHGIAWNFLLWGVWHGLGLFLHNRWVNIQRTRPDIVPVAFLSSQVGQVLSVLVTFHFVVVGWIWFVIPDVSQAWVTLMRLIGI
jgi:D-alanyl-lipoteichoic acid acyltransferase DltB (MBOAT superfamily)